MRLPLSEVDGPDLEETPGPVLVNVVEDLCAGRGAGAGGGGEGRPLVHPVQAHRYVHACAGGAEWS